MGSLWHTSSLTCVISRGKVSLLDRSQTQIFLAVTGLWGSCKVSLLASKKFSNVVVTSNSSCVFLYLFSSVNISPVRFVLHLQDWWYVGKRETSFPVNKLWLIYLPPSMLPLTSPFSFSHCGTKLSDGTFTRFVFADNDCSEVWIEKLVSLNFSENVWSVSFQFSLATEKFEWKSHFWGVAYDYYRLHRADYNAITWSTCKWSVSSFKQAHN